jgi:hypothetical protein
MGSTQEIHDREHELALALRDRLVMHLQQRERAENVSIESLEGGWLLRISFRIGPAPLAIDIRREP